MIRCVRIWTGDDRNSHFEEGFIDLQPGQRGDVLSSKMATTTISFEETASGGAFAWHTAPVRQLVITLSGTLDFQTREGQHFLIRPGEILFAADTAGGGHSWKLTDDQPWQRAYVVLQPGTAVPFHASNAKRLAYALRRLIIDAVEKAAFFRFAALGGCDPTERAGDGI